MALTNISKLEKRAEDHWATALALAREDNEWASVVAFYSCYQLARAALLCDPVFDDESELMEIHWHLRTTDKYATKHNVHQPGENGFGIVDLVQVLYKHVSGTYRVLHRGSTQVRYDVGLNAPLTVKDLMGKAKEFREEYQSGNLVYEKARHLNRSNTKKR